MKNPNYCWNGGRKHEFCKHCMQLWRGSTEKRSNLRAITSCHLLRTHCSDYFCSEIADSESLPFNLQDNCCFRAFQIKPVPGCSKETMRCHKAARKTSYCFFSANAHLLSTVWTLKIILNAKNYYLELYSSPCQVWYDYGCWKEPRIWHHLTVVVFVSTGWRFTGVYCCRWTFRSASAVAPWMGECMSVN